MRPDDRLQNELPTIDTRGDHRQRTGYDLGRAETLRAASPAWLLGLNSIAFLLLPGVSCVQAGQLADGEGTQRRVTSIRKTALAGVLMTRLAARAEGAEYR